MTATLQMLLDEGIGLYCRCRCGHDTVLSADRLIALCGTDFPIPDVPKHIRCTKCGHSPPEVQPDWPSKGQDMVKPIP